MSFRIRAGKSLGGISFSFGKSINNKLTAKEIKNKEFQNFLVKSASDLNESVFSFIKLYGYDPKQIQNDSIDLDELLIGDEAFEKFKALSLHAKEIIEKVIYSEDTGIKGKRDITDAIFELKSFVKSCPQKYHKPPQQFRSPAEVKFEKTKRILLWIGIFIMPYIFAWFTLSKTFTKNNRIIAFGWMLFVIILMLSGKN